MQVLLVEDDRDLAASVADYLALEQIQVDHAYNGQAGLTLATENRYDVLLLDLMLPRLDGLTLCEQLRGQGVDTPVLMLTARDTLDDKLAGFEAGTDDYLVKPFAMEELVARLRTLAKRRSGQVRKLQVADLQLELDSRTASRAGQPLKLTPSGWILLEALVRASPAVVSRHQLEQLLWPDQAPDSNSFKVHLYHLRKQVDKPFDRALIHTLPGQGVLLKDG
ncbi:response regulator transcription factor [Motiliproteus coralliicola]|uniref:response regulator transcription factor n=1 Tax=Motiliproteus coralliicola TaxID=2283196 RepID=UPI001A9F1FB3|nr:response regulator transcription factor [Motiliproteus coralliicola]